MNNRKSSRRSFLSETGKLAGGGWLDARGSVRASPIMFSMSRLAHLLGTCRMVNNPESSVTDRFHRSHEVPNLFICDGSSLVTSGRGQPSMTIQALAFRASEHIAKFAQGEEI